MNPVSSFPSFSVEEISDWLTELSIPASSKVERENEFFSDLDMPSAD
jgi:hypothetical protein